MPTDKSHVFLKDRYGVVLKGSQIADFEMLIGALNENLEEMHGCQIVYDRTVSATDVSFNGFAIFITEDNE